MNRSKKLVFFGNERLATAVKTGCLVSSGLIEAGYAITAIVASGQPGVSRQKRELEIESIAKKFDIPLLLPERVADISVQLKKLGAECGVLVAYGQLVPQPIIDIFPHGIINIHPSLLPKYRGPTPLETTILDGLNETGVSIMALAAKMDAGPVYAQQKLRLTGNETKQELADKALELGSKLLLANLDSILDNSLEAKAQADVEATYTKLLNKQDGLIDWDEPAEIIERKVRAFAGYPKCRAEIRSKDIIINKARSATDERDGDLVMACRPGWLEIVELTAPSGRIVTGAEFLRGLRG